MTKKISKITLVFLVAVFALSAVSFAAEYRSNEYIRYCDAYMISSGNGNVNINFTVYGTGEMVNIGVVRVQFFKSNGTLADTIEYVDPGYSNMMGYNRYTYSSTIPWQGTPGQSYYAEVNFFASDYTGGDGEIYTTNIVTA